jgi:N6-adenosine-specific RNA methylase IME4
MGYWVRGQHELLLIATRGNPPLPSTENVPASVIRERRREHSRKHFSMPSKDFYRRLTQSRVNPAGNARSTSKIA